MGELKASSSWVGLPGASVQIPVFTMTAPHGGHPRIPLGEVLNEER